MPPSAVMSAADQAAQSSGWPRPVRLPSSERASAKPMLMPAPMRRGEPNEERVPGVVRGDGGGEYRGQRRDGTIHQARKAGLHDLQHEEAAVGLVFSCCAIRLASLSCLEFVGAVLVRALFLRQVVEQLANAGVAWLRAAAFS